MGKWFNISNIFNFLFLNPDILVDTPFHSSDNGKKYRRKENIRGKPSEENRKGLELLRDQKRK